MLKVIALHGAPQAGKNTVVNLINKFTHVPRRITSSLPRRHFLNESFSSPMKELFHKIVGQTYAEEMKDQPRLELNGKTPRDGYIYLGRMDEHFSPDLWTRYAWFIRNDGIRAEAAGYTGILYESVGNQGQWDFFIQLRKEGKIDTRLIEVTRPYYMYTDNRKLVVDDPDKCMVVQNHWGEKELELQIKEKVIPWLLA